MWGLPQILALLAKVAPYVTSINVQQIASDVLDSIKKYWKLYLIALAALLQLTTAYGCYHYHDAFKSEKAVHQADVQSYKDAQKKANADAKAQEQQIIKESKVKANEADKNYSGLLTKYNASLLRYKATQGGSKSTGQYQGNDQEGSTAKVSDGPGASSFISITMNDAQICANNTARLMAAHQWALDIQNDKDN